MLENIQGYYVGLVALLPKLIIAIIIFSILFLIANRSKRIVDRRLTARMDDPLLARFLSRVVKTSVVIIGFLIALKIVGLGAAASGLLAGAGVSAFIIGFAFKDIGENLLSGVMLAFHRPFRIGDTVELNGIQGQVITLNLRDTQIKSFDGKDIYIPNANVIKNPVINYTIDGFLRNDFVIGLDYDDDVNQAIKITLGTLNKIKGILKEERAPSVSISSLGASTLNLTAYYWIDTFDPSVSGLKVKTEAIRQVLLALKEAGFYLPSDVLEIKNYRESSLKAS